MFWKVKDIYIYMCCICKQNKVYRNIWVGYLLWPLFLFTLIGEFNLICLHQIQFIILCSQQLWISQWENLERFLNCLSKLNAFRQQFSDVILDVFIHHFNTPLYKQDEFFKFFVQQKERGG
ncbi:unnamed protein product [Paramecium octaurelia]|uniref:Transmembrane protein n=1 Tax=Paramecium octaurelia TaxID=43137 RepID=A0A8S1WE01_PAROT|nr:unnamed protein product [Paramecium octaurelia]